MKVKPTLLGYVTGVSGGAIKVTQSPTVSSGIAIIGGKSYRIGQVGSFVRIPQGYQDLYGVVSEVSANPAHLGTERIPIAAEERWLSVHLVGEATGSTFERGLSQFPSIGDEVHLVTEESLSVVYGAQDASQIAIGRLANAEGIPVRIDIDRLVSRHVAVLGSTGAGKSTTVASLLRSIVSGDANAAMLGGARILMLDVHGEYGQAFRDLATTFRVNPTAGEERLVVPFWALEPTDLLEFLIGKLDDKPLTQVLDKIYEAKLSVAKTAPLPGLDPATLTAGTPLPFSLSQLWLDLLDPEVRTWSDKDKTVPALVSAGDASTLTPPKYLPHGMGSTAPFMNSVGVLGIRRGLDQMRSKLLDRRFDFLLHPGDWEPSLQGISNKDLADLLASWMGHGKPITILDLSGIPSAVLTHLIAAILKILYEGLFWGREKSEGGKARPVLVVMEEAHRYLGADAKDDAKEIVQRIVKEGRKFGVGAMIVSQRPSEVDETILSQCGTFIALRMSNSADRTKVQGTLPDNLAGVLESLSVLRTGEAIITGEAARLPIRCRITLPREEYRPRSEDPAVAERWSHLPTSTDFRRLTASWRSQNPLWANARVPTIPLNQKEIDEMERETVDSSTILSVGYDKATETLEIEFKSGGVYQYYNVPEMVFEQLMQSGSKGKFHHAQIKNAFPYSRV